MRGLGRLRGLGGFCRWLNELDGDVCCELLLVLNLGLAVLGQKA